MVAIRDRPSIRHGLLMAFAANTPEIVKNTGIRSGRNCSPSVPHALGMGRPMCPLRSLPGRNGAGRSPGIPVVNPNSRHTILLEWAYAKGRVHARAHLIG